MQEACILHRCAPRATASSVLRLRLRIFWFFRSVGTDHGTVEFRLSRRRGATEFLVFIQSCCVFFGSQAPALKCQSPNSVHAGTVTCAILDSWSSGNVAFPSMLCLLLTLA
jgi:hypothetical protein